MNLNDCTCAVETCDIFDFMAKHVGLTVLHPGGLVATKLLLGKCGITGNSHVLDIACGKGTTSVLVARKTGCRVTGIDIDPELIEEAKILAKIQGVDDLTEFLVGDATNLPFENDTFDVTIAQAMLVLIDNRQKVIQEAFRVLKPTGIAGWIELTWQQQPSAEFIKQVSDVICAYCMLNVRLAEGWTELFQMSGAMKLSTEIFPMKFNGFLGMVKDEGIGNALRVITKYFSDSRIRTRMKTMNSFFARHHETFGFGIYTMAGKEIAAA
jgi:ubiquinone/menaquinone biosynthesis C-methylase UbiE